MAIGLHMCIFRYFATHTYIYNTHVFPHLCRLYWQQINKDCKAYRSYSLQLVDIVSRHMKWKYKYFLFQCWGTNLGPSCVLDRSFATGLPAPNRNSSKMKFVNIHFSDGFAIEHYIHGKRIHFFGYLKIPPTQLSFKRVRGCWCGVDACGTLHCWLSVAVPMKLFYK